MWTEHTDEQGQKFFYNRDQQRSVWTDPRPARCHSLYLQMKALRVMSSHCGQAGRLPENFGRNVLNRELGPGGNAKKDKSGGNERMPQHLSASDDGGGVPELEALDRGKDKHKKKKRKEKDKGDDFDDRPPFKDELPRSDLRNGAPPALSNLGGLSKVQASPLEFKKPPMSAVEEVRQSLGIGNGGGGLGGGLGKGGFDGGLPPLGRNPMAGPLGRLSTPPGDGLSSVGRARVRAGIKLEPLRA